MNSIVGGILCGGYSKRLWPLTNVLPKVLLEISNGYTIMDRQLNQLKNVGIKDVYLLAGYLYEKIKERYGEEWNGLRIHYFVEEEPGGTIYAINNLLGNIESDFYLVMNGDIVTDINLLRMLKNAEENTVSMAVTRLKSPYGIVNISESKIIGFEEKPELPYYINAGIYVISKKLKDRFLAFKSGDAEKLIFPLLAKEGLLKYYFEKDALWYSVDSHKDLETVRSEFLNREDMPWGFVKTIVLTEKYMVRRVYIMGDFSTPIYVHREKDESIHVVSGKGRILLDDKEIQVKEGDVLRIRPGQKHSITALENLTLMEYSTPHPADRIEVE
ncbi:MAG: sugar phosphate nucleotidyltransferase [Thermoproteota archaeon]